MIERMFPARPEYSGERAGILMMVCAGLAVALAATVLRVM